MINIVSEQDCCGCSACAERCPKSCISMLEDQEGFLYPVVDKEKCVNCHLCEQVCPVLDKTEAYSDSFAYAAKNRNEDERLNSSSGGLFIVLAKYFLVHGGIVFGAVFDSNFEVYHTYSSDLDGVKPMMRSKYVQSNIRSSYIDCENFLKQGKKVLFTGTPCQIDGLRHFLKKEYDNLLMVDVICHGVPSPGVWRRYLRASPACSGCSSPPTTATWNTGAKPSGGAGDEAPAPYRRQPRARRWHRLGRGSQRQPDLRRRRDARRRPRPPDRRWR